MRLVKVLRLKDANGEALDVLVVAQRYVQLSTPLHAWHLALHTHALL